MVPGTLLLPRCYSPAATAGPLACNTLVMVHITLSWIPWKASGAQEGREELATPQPQSSAVPDAYRCHRAVPAALAFSGTSYKT